jgi:hypothetical protein
MPKRLVVDDPKKQKNHTSEKAAKGKKIADLKPTEINDLLLRIARKLEMVDDDDNLL